MSLHLNWYATDVLLEDRHPQYTEPAELLDEMGQIL